MLAFKEGGIDIPDDISFDEESHTYTNKETGDIYRSVTTVLGDFKPKFDKHLHAKRVAKKFGVSKQQVLDEWEDIKNKACDRGTAFHKKMEDYIKKDMLNYINTKVISESLKEHESLVKSFNASIRNYKFVNKILSEKLLFDHNSKIAGTGDVFVITKDGFHVNDFKTNKRFRFFSDWCEFMKEPVEHLSVCEYNTYSLQLSMYAYMFEKLTGLKCLSLKVLYLQESREKQLYWRDIPLIYLKHDVINIMNKHYEKTSKEQAKLIL